MIDSDYKERRRMQMLKFIGATVITLVSCRLMMNKMQKKRCMYCLVTKLNHKAVY